MATQAPPLDASAVIALLEEVISVDAGGRGIHNCFIKGQLELAARRLLSASSVLIATGFYIARCGAPETDGPPGAYAIARALAKLGKRACIVTDALNADALAACVAQGSAEGLIIGLAVFPTLPVEVATAEPPPARSMLAVESEFATTLLAEWSFDVLLSIERLGVARDGRYYSMRALNLIQYTARIDLLFESKGEGVFSIGIGDGGNEIGMGRVQDRIASDVPNGATIGTTVCTDALIVTGVSNWGGYAIAAALAALSGDMTLCLPAAVDSAVLDALLALGVVDGVRGACERSIDGLDWDAVHAPLLARLAGVAETATRA